MRVIAAERAYDYELFVRLDANCNRFDFETMREIDNRPDDTKLDVSFAQKKRRNASSGNEYRAVSSATPSDASSRAPAMRSSTVKLMSKLRS